MMQETWEKRAKYNHKEWEENLPSWYCLFLIDWMFVYLESKLSCIYTPTYKLYVCMFQNKANGYLYLVVILVCTYVGVLIY